jgi:hypothetical protein
MQPMIGPWYMLRKDLERSNLRYGGSARRHQCRFIRTSLLRTGYGCVLHPPTWMLPAAKCLSFPPIPTLPTAIDAQCRKLYAGVIVCVDFCVVLTLKVRVR